MWHVGQKFMLNHLVGRKVGGDEPFRNLQQHVVVLGALQDQRGWQMCLLAAFQHKCWITFVHRSFIAKIIL
jgi:hypothetical protein